MRRSERVISHRSVAPALVALAIVGLSFDNGGYGNVAVAVITVVAWIGAAVAAWIFRPRLSRPAARTVAALAGLLVLAAVSMAWANDAGRAFAASERVAACLGVLLLALAVMPKTGIRPWLVGLCIGITAVGAVALASRCGAAVFGDADRSLYSDLPSATGRLSYPIGYWNGLASLLALGLVLLTWLSDAVDSRLSRRLAVAAMPGMWLAIYLTSSRAGFVAALAGSAAVILFSASRWSRAIGALLGALGGIALIGLAQGSPAFLAGADTASAHRYGLAMAAGVVAMGALAGFLHRPLAEAVRRLEPRMRIAPRLLVPVLVIAGLVVLVAADPASRLHEFEQPDFRAPTLAPGQRPIVSASGSGRYQFWSTAVDAWASSPVHGVGAGNYELYWNSHPGGPVAIRNAHSLYLETLAELGPVGLGLLLTFLLAAPLGLQRRWRERRSDDLAAAFGLVIAGVISAAVDWTFQLPAAFFPVVVALAAIAVSAPAPEPERAGSGRARIALAALALIGWVAVFSGVVTVMAERDLAASRAAVDRGDLAAAAASAHDAASLEPFSPDPQIQLALVELRARRVDAATMAAAAAVRLAPGDWRSWLVTAQVDFVRGDPAAARVARDQLRNLVPVPLGSLSER